MNIEDFKFIPLDQFSLLWRFNDPNYDQLNSQDLTQIRPFDTESADRVSKISESLMEGESPSKSYFPIVVHMDVGSSERQKVIDWLLNQLFFKDMEVVVTWDKYNAVICPYRVFASNFDSFCYPGSDDVTVFPLSTKCILFYHHEGHIYVGSCGA